MPTLILSEPALYHVFSDSYLFKAFAPSAGLLLRLSLGSRIFPTRTSRRRAGNCLYLFISRLSAELGAT